MPGFADLPKPVTDAVYNLDPDLEPSNSNTYWIHVQRLSLVFNVKISTETFCSDKKKRQKGLIKLHSAGHRNGTMNMHGKTMVRFINNAIEKGSNFLQ